MTQATNAVQRIRDEQRESARSSLLAATQKMLPLLAGRFSQEQWASLMLGALTDSPKLLDCTPVSLIRAFGSAAQAGLVPNGADATCYIVPYGDTATFMLSYHGLLELVTRNGDVLDVQASLVRSGDEFVLSRGTTPFVKHNAPVFAESRGDIIGAYALLRTVKGGVYVSVLSIAELEATRRRSASPDKGAWVTDREAMYLKTVVRRVCNYLPKIWIPQENENTANADEQGAGDATPRKLHPETNNKLLDEGGVDGDACQLISAGQGG